LQFDWDPAKAASNERKHKVSFDEAQTIFKDPRVRELADEEHSVYEDRFRAIGKSSHGQILTVIYTFRGELTRIISARVAVPRERSVYDRRS
jgi:hypothetical protein